MQTECDMVFYNYENSQNFPLIINFPKLDSNNQKKRNIKRKILKKIKINFNDIKKTK